MPRPNSSTTIQRPDLASLAAEYIEAPHVGLEVFPWRKVPEQSADYPTQPDEWVVNIPNTRRAPRANYARGGWEFGTDTYACAEDGYEEPLDDVEAKLYARYFDCEVVTSQRVTATLMRVLNKRILDACQALSATGVGTEWNTASTCTPATNVQTGKNTIEDATGLVPDTLVIARDTLGDLRVATDVTGKIQYTYPAITGRITLQLLAEYFDIDRILVSRESYNSENEGDAAVLAKVWSHEYALLALTNKSDDLYRPQLGRTFLWSEESGNPLVVETYREESKRANIYRARLNDDVETIWTAAGYLMNNIHT